MRVYVLGLAAVLLCVAPIGCGGDESPEGDEVAGPAAPTEPPVLDDPAPTDPPTLRDPLPVETGFTRFVNTDRGYAVQYPEDWEVVEPMFAHMPVLFRRPATVQPVEGEPKELRETFGVQAKKRSAQQGPNSTFKAELNMLVKFNEDMELVSDERLEWNGRPMMKVVMTGTEGGQDITYTAYFVLGHYQKVVYGLSGTTLSSTADTYGPIFERAFERLEILDELSEPRTE